MMRSNFGPADQNNEGTTANLLRLGRPQIVVENTEKIVAYKESHARSILKGLSWRIIATSMIFIITYFTTGEIAMAMKVAAIEFPVKLLIYYAHERAWQLVPRGGIRKMLGIKPKN